MIVVYPNGRERLHRARFVKGNRESCATALTFVARQPSYCWPEKERAANSCKTELKGSCQTLDLTYFDVRLMLRVVAFERRRVGAALVDRDLLGEALVQIAEAGHICR